MDAMKTMKVWGVGSAVVLGLSAVLPWVSALGTSYSLMDGGDGPILLGAAALTVAALVWKTGWLGSRVLAVLVAGFGLYESIHVWLEIRSSRDEAEGFGALIGIGFGLYIAALAAASLVIWAGYQQFRGRHA